MYLSTLKLKNFRNYTDIHLEFLPRLNIFVGDNAQGKTNIIEAIYFLSGGRSFRTDATADLVCWGEETATLETELVREELRDRIIVEVGQTGKHFFRNGKKCRGIPELTTVLFAPEALRLTKEGPSARREFLDHLLGQLYPAYRPALRSYKQALVQHNRLLKDENATKEIFERQMDGWKTQLIEYGAELSALRDRGIIEINRLLPEAYAAIAGKGTSLLLHYQPRNIPPKWVKTIYEKEVLAAWRACLAQAFRERADDERQRRETLVGPHRDDVITFIGRREVRSFASQGEHRSGVLALKRCEILLLKEAHGYPPILLLDDVASELDPDRNRSFFLHLLESDGQVIVSAVSSSAIIIPESRNARWFAVDRGNARNFPNQA